MAAPVDPFPNFVPGALADGDQVDARFTALFVGLDRSKPSGGLDAASLKDGMLALSLLVQEPWQSVALIANFSPATLEFRKDPLGQVRFKGKVYTVGTTVGGSVTIATLPAGYRPGTQVTLPISVSNSGASDDLPVMVNTDGTIVTFVGGGPASANSPAAFTGSFWAEL